MTLTAIENVIKSRIVKRTKQAIASEKPLAKWKKLFLGFDLGTANMVIVALNEKGEVVTAVSQSSKATIRDGVLVDYWGATRRMAELFDAMKLKIGCSDPEIAGASAAYPPGIDARTVEACGNVINSLGLECTSLFEEPVAAAVALGVVEGAIVDIGGGTTGISVFKNGNVVYTADEPTGGEHMTLVLAGSLKIPYNEAEKIKCDPERQQELFPVVKPVIEKMATIAGDHLEKMGYAGEIPVILVGGGASFSESRQIFSTVTGGEVYIASSPMLVTPAGIALSLFMDSNSEKQA